MNGLFSSRLGSFSFMVVTWLLAGVGLSPASAEGSSPEPDSGNLRSFIELVRKDVRMEKAMLLAANIDFTEDEAIMFWPAYNEYELELGKWYNRRFDLIKDYLTQEKTLTDEGARKLAEDVFSTEGERTKLKRKYFRKFSKIVGAKKAVRFFQIENQLNAAIDLRIAASLPLIK